MCLAVIIPHQHQHHCSHGAATLSARPALIARLFMLLTTVFVPIAAYIPKLEITVDLHIALVLTSTEPDTIFIYLCTHTCSLSTAHGVP